MNAETFLDQAKRRTLRISFPEFDIYDDDSVLLDVHLTEVMNDCPDVKIGNLVIPELTVKTEYLNLKNHLNEILTMDVGIETETEPVTDEILKIQETFPGETLIFARSITGCYFVANGKKLYNVWFDDSGAARSYQGRQTIDSVQEIAGIYFKEESAESGGHIYNASGMIYLMHETEPSLTCIAWQGRTIGYYETRSQGGFFVGDEQELTVSGELHQSVISNMVRQRTALTRTNRGTAQNPKFEICKLDLKFIRYYNFEKTLCRKVISGVSRTFSLISYGNYIITETSSRDEETTEIICYGILHQLVDLDARSFFSASYFYAGESFSKLYDNFIIWINQQGINITAKTQNFINLNNLTVSENWSTADFSGITADMILREFAMLEGGNAFLNHDGLLELGWCGAEPVLTASAENLSMLKIGTERLTPATGIMSMNAASANIIQTEFDEDDLHLMPVINESHDDVFQRIISKFSDISQIAFTASLLTGASPYLRAGDCIRLITRDGAAVCVPVFMQDVKNIPFMDGRVSVPDGTSWMTVPVDFDLLSIVRISVDNWPEFLIHGISPDTSEMLVRAVLKNDETFRIPESLYQLHVRTREDYPAYLELTVTFMEYSASKLIPAYYALYTANQQIITTNSGAVIAVKGANA